MEAREDDVEVRFHGLLRRALCAGMENAVDLVPFQTSHAAPGDEPVRGTIDDAKRGLVVWLCVSYWCPCQRYQGCETGVCVQGGIHSQGKTGVVLDIMHGRSRMTITLACSP